MIRATLAGVVLAATLVARAAFAAPCVAVAPRDDVLDERGRARMAEQLAASLATHDIATCRDGDAALAEVTFEPGSAGAVVVRVRDAVTRKEVARVARLAGVPRDGRPLALAIAADELLRASWAEILLARAPAPPSEPPPEVRAVVQASLPPAAAPPPPAPVVAPPSPVSFALPDPSDADVPSRPSGPESDRRFVLAAALAGEHATGGLSLGGVDVRVTAFPLARLGLALRVGARAAPTSSGADGSADAKALVGGAGLDLALLPRGRTFGLDVPVRVDVARVAFTAHPTAGSVGDDDEGWGVSAATGLAASARFAPGWSVVLEGTLGAIVKEIDARDGSATFTAWSGAVVGAALGVSGAI